MKKVNLDTVIVDFDGKPIPLSGAKDAEPLTLRMVIKSACEGFAPNEHRDLAASMRLYRMGIKVAVFDEMEFTEAEITMLKNRINLIWPSPLTIGKACDLLDPESAEDTAAGSTPKK